MSSDIANGRIIGWRLVAAALVKAAILVAIALYVMASSLIAFFPSWPVLRIGLPVIVALTLMTWAVLASQLSFGASAKYPDDPIQWLLLVLGPASIVGAGALVFLLAWSRRPAARVI